MAKTGRLSVDLLRSPAPEPPAPEEPAPDPPLRAESPQSRTSSPGNLAQQPESVGKIGDSLADFEILRELGRGAFGVVFLVRSHLDSSLYVLKKLRHSRRHKDTLREAKLLRKLRHPHLVTYHHCFIEAECLYLVMEFAEGGDLYRLVKRQKAANKHLDELQIWHYGYQLLLGLSYLHSNQILHRDIKCMNLLLDKHNRLKIGDLGVSKLLTTGAALTPKPGQRVGTPLYLAPEVVRHQPYDYKADMWAVGCVLYQLAALQAPFKGENLLALNNAIVHREATQLPKQYSTQLNEFVDELLEKRQDRRLEVWDALKRIPPCVRVQYDFKELELQPIAAPKASKKEIPSVKQRKASVKLAAVVSVAEQRELLLQGRDHTPRRAVPKASKRGSSMRPTTSASAQPTDLWQSRNAFATFYRGIGPSPLRTRTSLKEVPAPKSRIEVPSDFPLERLDLSRKIQARLKVALPAVRPKVQPPLQQQSERPTTSLVRGCQSVFTSKRPSTHQMKPPATLNTSPRRALTPHICDQLLTPAAECKGALEVGSMPGTTKPPKVPKQSLDLMRTVQKWASGSRVRMSTDTVRGLLSPPRRELTESTAASKCEMRTSVQLRRTGNKRFTVADLQ